MLKHEASSWTSDGDPLVSLSSSRRDKLRVKRVCQRCVHTVLSGFKAVIDTASGYSWYAVFILALLCVVRPGGSLKRCQRTCGEGGSWQTLRGITAIWKTTPRVSWCWFSSSHQRVDETLTWSDSDLRWLGMGKQIKMLISLLEQVQLKVYLL